MLDEARRRHERGEDVVVAAIQPQQSEDLQALLQKLELVPMLLTPEGQAIDIAAELSFRFQKFAFNNREIDR